MDIILIVFWCDKDNIIKYLYTTECKECLQGYCTLNNFNIMNIMNIACESSIGDCNCDNCETPHIVNICSMNYYWGSRFAYFYDILEKDTKIKKRTNKFGYYLSLALSTAIIVGISYLAEKINR
jgi:hypothetical protein